MIVFRVGLLSVFLSLGLVACSGENTPQTAEQKEKLKLFDVARKNGCMECHRVNATVIGPSWEDIAERYKDGPYEATRDMLVQSVMLGSKGKWATWKAKDGMPPLARRVDKQVVIELSEYILNLKRTPTAGEAPPAK